VAEVVWTRRAALEVGAVRAYVGQFSPLAAQRLSTRLVQAARSLESLPDRGRLISAGRRELTIVPPYLIRYARYGDRVIILEIRHSARHTN